MAELSESYSPADTAIVLVDLLNEFLSPEGKLHGAIAPLAQEVGLEDNIKRLIAGARRNGITLIYSPHGLDEHTFEGVKHVHPRFAWAKENQMFWADSPGADFYAPLAPRAEDIVLERHHMFDNFMGTDLEQQLRQRGIEKVVLAGLTSQTCVEGTGRHALEAGYHVTFLSDAVADFSTEAHRAAIDLSYPTFGHVVTTVDGFLGAIKEAARV